MRNWVDDFDPTEDDIQLLTSAPAQPPGLSSNEETGGAYITISQKASEVAQHPLPAAPTPPTAPS